MVRLMIISSYVEDVHVYNSDDWKEGVLYLFNFNLFKLDLREYNLSHSFFFKKKISNILNIKESYNNTLT